MSKFKVGDKVRVVSLFDDVFFSRGAEGVVVDRDHEVVQVRFVSGRYDHGNGGRWWVYPEGLELITPYSSTFTKQAEAPTPTGLTTDGGGLQKYSVGELYPLAVVGYCNGGATTFVVEDLQKGAVVCDWKHLDGPLWKYAKAEDAFTFARSVPNRGRITFVYQRPSFVNNILSI
jgi:hypothetical protein